LWPAYGGIAALPQNFHHLTVNHGIGFVDAVTGAHTQNIESEWSLLKARIKIMYGVHQPQLEGFLNEFNWRQRFSRHTTDGLYNLWSHIKAAYPCNPIV